MCEVIALTPRTVSRPAPVGGAAEILFFTGVRYHRMSDDEFEKAVARKPTRPAKKSACAPCAQAGLTFIRTAVVAAPARR